MDFHHDEPYSSRHTDALEALKRLLRLGARFHPEDCDELLILRRCLLKLDWFDGYELLKCVHTAAALSSNQAAKLFKEPRLRSHLEKRLPALSCMFPVLKQWVGPRRRAVMLKAAGSRFTASLNCSGARHKVGLWLRLDFCGHAASHHEAQTGEEGEDDIHGGKVRRDKVHGGSVLGWI